MTNNNNENIDKDYNLEWEESTKHQDEFKNKKKGLTEQMARKALWVINGAIKTYNYSVGNMVNGVCYLATLGKKKVDVKIPEINPDMSLEEIQKTGAGTFGLGAVDGAIKGVRRVGLPMLQSMNIAGYGGSQLAAGLAKLLAPVETAIDHIKDLLTSSAFGNLAANIGDLKDGQARLGKTVNAQGKKIGDIGDKLDGVGNRVGDLEGEMEGMGDRVGNLEESLEQGLGSVKEGLNDLHNDVQGLKSDLETQGHELREAMGEMKSELEEQIQQQAEHFDQKLQEQDAKFTEEISRVDNEIAGLKGEMQQQKQQLRNEIRQHNEETKRQLRKEMESQKQELEKQINELTRAQKEINQEVQEQIYELDEWINKVEQKTLQNATKIFQEKLERQTKDEELTDAIKTTNSKLENLNQEKQDLTADFSKYQGKINQQTAQTQQDLESLETEYTQQTNSLNAKIATNQDRLDDYEEEQQNIKLEQKKLDLNFRELAEDVETNTQLIQEQAKKLEFVARGMEEIAEETHERINKLHTEIFDLNEQTEEALFTAKQATRKIDNLTEELEKERERIKNLESQIEKNKQDTQSAKLEAELANLRLDNLLKSQELSDFTEQDLIFAKLQNTLQLKADEAKLLAQLNLLQYAESTAILEEPAEREWKVGIQEGTARQIPRPEGMPLVAGSRWEKQYSSEELREMGWDVRLKDENETAPLTTPEKRKPETTQSGAEIGEPQETELNQELLTEIEQTKSKLLEQLQDIQARIGKNLETVENQPKVQSSEAEKKEQKANLSQLENQEKELRKQRASAKAQLTHQTKSQQSTKQEITQLKSAISKETKQLEKTEQQLSQTTNQNQTQQLQNQQQTSQQNLAQFQEQLQEKQEQLTAQSQQITQSEQAIETQSQQIEQIQTETQTIKQTQASQPLEQAINQQTIQAAQIQQQILEKEWEEVQDFQQEVLEDAPAPTPPPVAKLMEEEAAQAAAAASSASESSSTQEKQMTYFMLFLIIFLLEYIVYKRNGLPGLVILNICLAIAYYHKDTLMEYIDLWDKYVLIIGYVMGNVLAYSAPEQEKYKWPSVVGFNAIIALLYAYTWYQKRQITQQTEKKIEKIHEDTKQKIQEQSKLYEEKVERIEKGHIKHQKSVVNQLETRPKTQPKQLVLEVQLEHAQEAINQAEDNQDKEELRKEIAQIQQTLQEIKKTNLKSTVNIDLLENQEPGIKDEWQRVKNWLKTINPEEQESKNTFSKLTSFIDNLPLNEEESNLLIKLHLTPPQTLAISSQSPRVKYHWAEIQANYSKLTITQKLKLLNSGLEALGLKTTESKQSLANIRQQIHQETQSFDLTLKEKENILRLLITNLNLNPEQRTSLEEMEVEFFNASNWQVSEEQKNQLLSFGLNKVELTEEQEKTLTKIHPDSFKTFAFNEPQKIILQSLAPLTKEHKYSKQLLEAIHSLKLKAINLSFLINEEVLPDINTQFGETKSPYLPLKNKFLSGEKKVLEQIKRESEKEINQEEMKKNKRSIVASLMKFTEQIYKILGIGNLDGASFTLDHWVKLNVLTSWQRDILLTCGFKTVPKYNYFELLSFAVEKFTDQSFADFLETNSTLKTSYQNYLNSQRNQEFTINQDLLAKFASSQTSQQKEIFKQLNLQEIINEQISQRLAGYQFASIPTQPPVKDWEKWKDISSDFTENLVRQWENNSFSYETTKEWIQVGLTVYDANFAQWLRDEAELTPELVLNAGNEPELRELFAEHQQAKLTISPKIKPTSPYDDLLTGLDSEEREQQKKKLQRQEFRQKLDQANLSRRQANLSAKDHQLTAEQTRYQQELELEAQENQKRSQLRQQREKELKEQEERRLKAKEEQIERNRNLAQQSLETKQREMALEETRQKARIQSLEEQNKLEQQRLQNQAQLLEEQTKKKLESIALEDEEQRQQILKDQQKQQAELETERLEQERNYQREKNTQELAAQAREQQQKEELRNLELQLKKEEYRQLEVALEKEKEITLNAAKFKQLNFKDFCNKFVDKTLENIMVYISGGRDYHNTFYQDKHTNLGWLKVYNVKNVYWFNDKSKLTDLFRSYPHGRFNLFQWVTNRPKVSLAEEESYKNMFLDTKNNNTVYHQPWAVSKSYHITYLNEKPYLTVTTDQRFLASILGNNFFTIAEMKQILMSKCSSIEMIQEQLEILRSKEGN